jgi:tocopherol O-methyltransferase
MGDPRFDTADITRYYDHHTRSFVRFGQGGGSIHRAVWGPGVANREQAFHYVDDRIAALIRAIPPPSRPLHVVDLGCGVGASLCYLSVRFPIRGTGITLSPAQAAIARTRIERAGLADRVVCLEADYCDLPSSMAQADLAYAIESFVHGPSPERFLAECHRLLRPGGLLVICDDVRRPADAPATAAAIEAFTRGWHINTLIEREALVSMARAAGFEHQSTVDLTPFLEIHRLRDRVLAVWIALLRRLRRDMTPYAPVVGGQALQACLARGWIGYELSVFRRHGG